MLKIFYTFARPASDELIRYVLQHYYNIPDPQICKTFNGKPYAKGEKIEFSLTHSKEICAIAVGDTPIGFDCEGLSGKTRPAVLSRFSERERSEICCDADFLAHWTAKESYVKYLGETLAACWRKLEFYQGKIYFCGNAADVNIMQFTMDNTVFSICGHDRNFAAPKLIGRCTPIE